MIETLDPTLYLLVVMTILSGVVFASILALFWWRLRLHHQTIARLQQENAELRKLLKQYTQKVRART